MKSTRLFFTQGNSDKEYRASIEKSGAGFIVNFAYGRRGSALRNGTKTADPVDFDKAVNIYEKLISSKTSKGYTCDGSGAAFVGTDKNGSVSGVNCQLLNEIEDPDSLLTNTNYIAQEKHDGVRQMIEFKDSQVQGINRKGLYVALEEGVVNEVNNLGVTSCLIDGEGIGSVNHSFDILELNGQDLRDEPYFVRHRILTRLLHKFPCKHLSLVTSANNTVDKKALFERIESEGGEGVVFKQLNAPFTVGKPASGGSQLKFKFYATASVLVQKRNSGKRSVAIGLVDGTNIGNVAIPANQAIPESGQIIEVRYLYAYLGGSLYQPTYLGVRTDLNNDACDIKQLKYKPVDKAA